MVGMPVTLELFEDFDKGLTFFKKFFKSLKNSLDPFGILYLFTVTVNLPFFFPKLMINHLTNKCSLVFSNTYCTKIPLNFDGKKGHGGYYFASTPGVNSCSFTLCTMGDVMMLGMFSDKNSMKDPQRMIEICEEKYMELIKRLKD